MDPDPGAHDLVVRVNFRVGLRPNDMCPTRGLIDDLKVSSYVKSAPEIQLDYERVRPADDAVGG